MITAVGLAATKNIGSITKNTGTLIDWLEVRLVPGWERGFAKTMAEEAKQTASYKTFNQGSAAVAGQLQMQAAAGEAAERAVQPASLTTTITNSVMLAEQTSIVRSKATAYDAFFMAGFFSKTAVDYGIVIERHKPYCSQQDANRGRCVAAASPTMQNADLTLNTILNPGEGQYETLADDERNAGLAFVKNVVHPVPVIPLPKPHAGSEQAKAYEAALLAEQAALSLVAHSFNKMIARRTRRHQSE